MYSKTVNMYKKDCLVFIFVNFQYINKLYYITASVVPNTCGLPVYHIINNCGSKIDLAGSKNGPLTVLLCMPHLRL